MNQRDRRLYLIDHLLNERNETIDIEYSANGRPLVTVEKSTQYAKQVHLTKKLNTVGSPF